MTREEIRERTIFYNLLRLAFKKNALIVESVILPEGENLSDILKTENE